MSASNSTVELQPGPVMVDVEGLSLTEHERQRLRHPLVGGVILFARNFRDRDQLHDLCRQIRLARKAPLLIAVDQDRKSTRLNSSHVAISYAVFCLKKKTEHRHTRRHIHAQ